MLLVLVFCRGLLCWVGVYRGRREQQGSPFPCALPRLPLLMPLLLQSLPLRVVHQGYEAEGLERLEPVRMPLSLRLRL